jgi:putative ABC transport system substrate-binding protein
MRRPEFIAFLGCGVAGWPLSARAQQRDGVRRIGVLIGVAGDAETKGWVAAFRKRLDELGWRVGGNLQIEERWTAGDPEQNRHFAGELLAVKPDAIFAFSSVAVAALQQESGTVPIVFTAISDPMGSGGAAASCRSWRTPSEPGGQARKLGRNGVNDRGAKCRMRHT